jgi:hypothetical protein
MYADLAQFGKGKISYRHDEKSNFWFAVYDKLTAKEMRALLKSRGQGVSGTRALLFCLVFTPVISADCVIFRRMGDMTS